MSEKLIKVKYDSRVLTFTVDEYVKDVCKIGQDAECCKYLTVGGTGYFCCKVNAEDKDVIDTNWDDSKSAQGDNCEGVVL